jgi:hypothetical protein
MNIKLDIYNLIISLLDKPYIEYRFNNKIKRMLYMDLKQFPTLNDEYYKCAKALSDIIDKKYSLYAIPIYETKGENIECL